ncbi:MAG: hypothetical protein ABEJ26_05410 [Halosimplex sp.]
MARSDDGTLIERSRLGWWLFVAGLAAVAGFILWRFVGMVVLGVFGYYATRPINDRVDEYIDSDAVAAAVTVLVVLVPVAVLSLYAGYQFFTIVQHYTTGTVDPLSLAARYFNVGDVPLGQRQSFVSALKNPSEFVRNPQQKVQMVLKTGRTVVSMVAKTFLLIALSITLSFFLLK